jgi:hypothetical protein
MAVWDENSTAIDWELARIGFVTKYLKADRLASASEELVTAIGAREAAAGSRFRQAQPTTITSPRAKMGQYGQNDPAAAGQIVLISPYRVLRATHIRVSTSSTNNN